MIDPYGDPREFDWNRAWTLHARRRYPDGMSRLAFEVRARALLERIDAVLDGAPTPDPELAALAREIGVWSLLPPDTRPVSATDDPPSLSDAARLAQDIAPATGADAPDRFLGPWADVLDAHDPSDRRVLLAAHAAALYLPVDDDKWERTPFLQWVRRTPHPPIEQREPLRAVEHAAPSLWRIEAIDGGLVLTDLVGINPGGLPTSPVRVPELASVDGGGGVGDCMMARVVPTSAGWVAPIALAVKGCPSEDQVRDWLRFEGFTARLDRQLKTRDDLLRLRPHVLWRRVHEWAWTRRDRSPAR